MNEVHNIQNFQQKSKVGQQNQKCITVAMFYKSAITSLIVGISGFCKMHMIQNERCFHFMRFIEHVTQCGMVYSFVKTDNKMLHHNIKKYSFSTYKFACGQKISNTSTPYCICTGILKRPLTFETRLVSI